MLRPLRIGITSGDSDGIGPEVVAKALRKIGPKKNVHFILWRNSLFPKRDLMRIKKSFKLITVNSWAEALTKMPSSPKELLDICGGTSPGKWVEEAAGACVFKHIDAMATAPLSKPSILAGGLTDVGHTDILKRVSQTKKAYMTFIGEKFSVMLLSGHLPIKDISSHLSGDVVREGVLAAKKLVEHLTKTGQKGISKKPLALLGLNPHAGDEGVIGDEEQRYVIPTLEALKAQGVLVEGPLVPDAAFTQDRWSRYSMYIAMYHDQGLIPFKAIHGQRGVHLTWGLPFVRTSVDHGTAFDIAGKDKADATSMSLALEWAIKLGSGPE